MSLLEIRPEERVHLKLTDSIPVHHKEIKIASKTPKQEDVEPDYFAPGDSLRRKKSNNEKPMKVTSAETVLLGDDKSTKTVNTEQMSDDDGKWMNIADTTHTAFDDRKTLQQQIYRLMSDSQLPVYTRLIIGTTLLSPGKNEVGPSGGIDLILCQKTDSDIQLMLNVLSGVTCLNPL